MVETPSLPGYKPHVQVTDHRRKASFRYSNDVMITLTPETAAPKPKMVQVPKVKSEWRDGSLPKTTTKDVHHAFTEQEFDLIPAYDALTGHVLRFYGYFDESVIESNLETRRIRRCRLLYYLQDDTIQVDEPQERNSGIAQGSLVRRRQVKSAGSSGIIKFNDLHVGTTIKVDAFTIHLVDADTYTREFYLSQNSEQAPASLIPSDNFAELNRLATSRDPHMKKTFEKVYREVMLGGTDGNPKMAQFLESDRKVARFYAIVEDMSTVQYERRPFVIFYFLSDDSVEIREQYPLNCGRDEFSIFFRRAKLPKPGQPLVVGPSQPALPRDSFVAVEDFSVGATVEMLSLKFFIYDADPFTRDFFAANLNQNLLPRIDVTLPEAQLARPVTPPYTGYGSWEDSLGSVWSLVPKVPTRDMHKLFKNEGRMLKFSAKFVNPKPEDKLRIFVFTYYLADDHVSIFEPPQRNSGIVTGMFLEKDSHLNKLTADLVKPEDLLPGKNVAVAGRVFEILAMDEYTARYFETGEIRKVHPVDISVVLNKLRDSFRALFPVVRDIFRTLDSDKNSVLTIEEVKQFLLKFGFVLTEEDSIAVMYHFDKQMSGQVSYNQLCDVLFDESVLKGTPANQVPREYKAKVLSSLRARTETEKIRRAVREVGDCIYKRYGFDKKLISDLGTVAVNHKVTSEQVRAVLMRTGNCFDQSDIDRVCIYVLKPQIVDLRKIDYVELVQAIMATFHDVTCR